MHDLYCLTLFCLCCDQIKNRKMDRLEMKNAMKWYNQVGFICFFFKFDVLEIKLKIKEMIVIVYYGKQTVFFDSELDYSDNVWMQRILVEIIGV